MRSLNVKEASEAVKSTLFATETEFHKYEFLALAEDIAAGGGHLGELLHEVGLRGGRRRLRGRLRGGRWYHGGPATPRWRRAHSRGGSHGRHGAQRRRARRLRAGGRAHVTSARARDRAHLRSARHASRPRLWKTQLSKISLTSRAKLAFLMQYYMISSEFD